MLVYYHSPLPPTKTGIADYSSELIPFLMENNEILFVENRYENNEREISTLNHLGLNHIKEEDWKITATRGVNLYQLGNNRLHSHILHRAMEFPGIAVIHDASLTGLLFSEQTNFFNRFVEYELGQEAEHWLEYRNEFKLYPWHDFIVRSLGLIVDTSLATIVHSKFVKELIERRYRSKSIFAVEHHLSQKFMHRSNASFDNIGINAFLQRYPNAVKIATFGFLTPPKRIDWLISAFRRAINEGLDVVLVLAGEPHPDTGIQALLTGLPPERVLVTGFLSEKDMLLTMEQVDLQVNLRFPSVGESSGTLIRALGLGTCCVVLNYEAFSDLPDGTVVKVELNENVSEQLFNVIQSYVKDPTPFRRLKEDGRAWATNSCKITASASFYAQVIAKVSKIDVAPSNFFVNIAQKLVDIVPDRLSVSCRTENVSTADIVDYFFESEAIRQEVRRFGCDLYAFDESDFEHLRSNVHPRISKRRVFVFVSSTESPADKFRQALLDLSLNRFDVLLVVVVGVIVSRTTPNRNRLVNRLKGLDLRAEGLVARSHKMLDIKFVTEDRAVEFSRSFFKGSVFGFEVLE